MNDKLKQIADYYGIEIQSVKLAEECAEYSAAGIKALYYMTLSEVNCSAVFDSDAIYAEHLKACDKSTEELADVLLMARQMEYLIDQRPEFREKINKLMEAKIERQLKRMEEGKAK